MHASLDIRPPFAAASVLSTSSYQAATEEVVICTCVHTATMTLKGIENVLHVLVRDGDQQGCGVTRDAERQLVVNSLSAYVVTLRAFGFPLALGVDLVANTATVACADGVMGP